MKIPQHFDNLEHKDGVFFARELEFVAAKAHDIKYADLMARQFIPVNNQVPSGAETYRYAQYDAVGVAKLIHSYATDLPRADVVGKEFVSRIRSEGASYGYNVQEIRAANMVGRPLEQRKANAARRAIEQLFDKIAFQGDSANGLLGINNQPNALVYTIPNGAGGFATWTTKTSEEILADLNGMLTMVVDTTNDQEHPNTLLMPLAQYLLISQKKLGTNSDTTVLEYWLKTNPYVKTVKPWYRLKGAGAAGADRLLMYRLDPDALEVIEPQPFEQFAPQQRGLEYVVPCHSRTGGVVLYYPLSMVYGDGV